MTLEAAALYQQQDLFSHNNPYPLLLESWPTTTTTTSSDPLPTHYLKSYDHGDLLDCYSLENQEIQHDWQSHNYGYNESNSYNPPPLPPPVIPTLSNNEWGINSCPDELRNDSDDFPMEMAVMRPRRPRRAKARKNKEDIENQRMAHIAVERNRRKQMNEYLNELRSLMPDSYGQRGDQASIVGGAIDFVKELEQNLQCLSDKQQMKEGSSASNIPFQEFFTFPQYTSGRNSSGGDQMTARGGATCHQQQQQQVGGGYGESGLVADVEVTMVESHANLKIRLRQPPKQLSRLITGLLCLKLTIRHLNVNTATDGVVLYSFSLKVEDGSELSSVDDIAGAVYQLLRRIQED